MLAQFKSNCFKPSKIFCLTLLFSLTISNAFAQESEHYNFPTGEQEGGGVRGDLASCDRNISAPIPLIPQNARTLTASASPKLFFDFSNVGRATAIDFILLNQENQIVYQNSLESNDKSGLIGLILSDNHNSDELKVNNSYHWYLVNQCDDLSEPQILKGGTLQRIELGVELTENINNASIKDKIKIYQEANLWHETVENLTRLKCSNSHTNIIEKELKQITSAIDISTKSFNASLNNYCAGEGQAGSIVMK